VSNHLQKSIQDLGNACKDLVDAAGSVQSNPRDLRAKKELKEAGRSINEKVSEENLQAACLVLGCWYWGGSRTTQLLQQSRGSIKMMGMKFVHFYIISEPVHPCHTCDDENREVVQSQRIYLISVIVAAIVHSTSVPCKKILH